MEERQNGVIRGFVLPKPSQLFVVVVESRSAWLRPKVSALSHAKNIPQKGEIHRLWL